MNRSSSDLILKCLCTPSWIEILSSVLFDTLSVRDKGDFSSLRVCNDRGTGLDPPYWEDESSAVGYGTLECLRLPAPNPSNSEAYRESGFSFGLLRGLQNSGGRFSSSLKFWRHKNLIFFKRKEMDNKNKFKIYFFLSDFDVQI